MKINGNEYAYLANAIKNVFNDYGDKSGNYKDNGLSFKRFCFDVFYASRVKIGDGVGIRGDITVPNCTDENIYTAVRKVITKELNVEKW